MASRRSLVAVLGLVAALLFAACAEEQAPSPADESLAAPTDDLDELVSGLPEPVVEAVRDDPEGFLPMLDPVLALPAEYTILVDKETPLPADYAPEDLVNLDDRSDELALSREGHRVTHDTAEALVEMSKAARADGVTLTISSTYRSYDYQADLFAHWVEELGAEEAARVSARPGTSQHQLGTTVDFGCICDAFAEQPAGRWLAEHGWEYGFSLSYPEDGERITGYSYEPWHFRYIGREATRLQREYFAGMQQWMLEFLHGRRDPLEAPR